MRDRRGRSTPPKPIGAALNRVLSGIAPKTALAEIQAVWAEAVGPQIDAVTEVVSEHEGTVVIECEGSVWAQELEMMAPQLIKKLTPLISAEPPQILRFRATG